MTQLPGSRGVEAYLERRIAAAVLIVLIVWLGLLGRLFYLQVVEGERFRDSAERNSVRTYRVKASRGMLLDTDRRILMDSRPSFDVMLVPHDAGDLNTVVARLADLVGINPELALERVGNPRGRARFEPIAVARDLDRAALARVGARLWALPGVTIRATAIRHDRFSGQASHLLGWMGEISAKELDSSRFAAYRRGDVIGKEGVERLMDRDLRGRDGGANVIVDAYGRPSGEPLAVLEPEPGKNVVLTIDHDLQAVAEAQFDKIERSGAVVALDANTGAVRVLLSRPGFDPNLFSIGLAQEDWAKLVNDRGKPLHNRALLGQYPPGSTYKVVTALAGLERGVIKPGFGVNCRGSHKLGRRRYRCWKRGGHGYVDLHRAIVQSCDVFFYQVGELLKTEETLGIDALAFYSRALGGGNSTGIDVGREAAGLVPTSAWKERRFSEPWIQGETLSAAIGQGFNLWTPLQLANAYAAIANGGKRNRPFVVERVEDPHGRLLSETKPALIEELPVSVDSLDQVRAGLAGVVQERRGTGYAMRNLPGGVLAAGKTGTAQVVALAKDPIENEEDIKIEHRDHAWFATYVPADDPELVVVVLVEHGGHGGSAAAPIAREIVVRYLEKRSEREPATLAELAHAADGVSRGN